MAVNYAGEVDIIVDCVAQGSVAKIVYLGKRGVVCC